MDEILTLLLLLLLPLSYGLIPAPIADNYENIKKSNTNFRRERELDLNFAEETQIGFLFGSDIKVRPHLAEIGKSNASSQCRNDSEYFMQNLHKQWALKMLDATSHIPSGIANGNFIWYGSFQECLQVNVNDSSVTESFKGKYCLASFRPTTSVTSPFQSIFVLYKKQLLASPITAGICLPSSCSSVDLEAYLTYLIERNALNVTASVDPNYCQTHEHKDLDGSAIGVIILLLIFASLVLAATLIEYLSERRKQMESINSEPTSTTYLNPRNISSAQCTEGSLMFGAITSFSLISNLKGFLNTQQPKGSISSLHGMRVFSMLWIVLLHTYSNSLNYIWRNYSEVYNVKRDWSAEMILNGNIAVDTFFFLSGLLVCYVTIRKLLKTGKFELVYFYVHRYWRLTPIYAVIIAVSAAIFPYLGSGPHWPEVIQQSQNCRLNWWTNLLYVSNIVRTNIMCQPHCWFLAADWQLYLLSPLIIYPLYRWPKIGISLALFFICIGIAIDSALTYVYHLPPSSIVLADNDAKAMLIYFVLLYMMPYMRFGPYCVGILLGYLLAMDKMKFKMKPIVVIIGWCSVLAIGIADIFGLYKHIAYDIELSSAEAVLYSAFSRPAWGICLAWVVIACCTGYGGIINSFLSWKPFIPWGRLTYCAYIIHYNLLVLYYGSRKSSTDFDHWIAMYTFFGTVVFANALAVVFHLMFEVPAMRIERTVLSWREKNKQQREQRLRQQSQELSTQEIQKSEM